MKKIVVPNEALVREMVSLLEDGKKRKEQVDG